jgi:hypothetical protein
MTRRQWLGRIAPDDCSVTMNPGHRVERAMFATPGETGIWARPALPLHGARIPREYGQC